MEVILVHQLDGSLFFVLGNLKFTPVPVFKFWRPYGCDIVSQWSAYGLESCDESLLTLPQSEPVSTFKALFQLYILSAMFLVWGPKVNSWSKVTLKSLIVRWKGTVFCLISKLNFPCSTSQFVCSPGSFHVLNCHIIGTFVEHIYFCIVWITRP